MPPADRQSLPRSVYADTTRISGASPILTQDATADVAIVGGGYTGLSAALHLAEAGVDAIVLEANEIGWGASGRNGGQVNPGLKWEPRDLEAGFGADLGGRMIRLGATAPDLVFNLIKRHDIACQPVRSGTIRAAVSRRSEGGVRDYHRDWLARGAAVDLLDGPGMAAATGTAAYPLGCLDRRGGNLNPLAFARGLAAAATRSGARIFVGSQAASLTKSGDIWSLATPAATVRARRVILATNGYTDSLWPGLKRTIVPVHSSIAATAPLPAQIAAEILPGRPALYEMSSTYTYYRVDADGRFLIGGRGVLRDTSDFADYAKLIARAVTLFPALGRAQWTHCWNGQTAVTWDHLPHVHEPAPGVSIGLGYNGRGIAMATAMGKMLAARANGAPLEAFDLPVTRMSPIVGHALWPLAVRARLMWERFRERACF